MNVTTFILLVSAAGPVIGSAIGVLRKPSENVMYNMLYFAAGIMLAISFLELIPQAIEMSGVFYCIAGLAIGSLVMYAFDKFLPHIHPGLCREEEGHKIHRTALYLIVGIFLHNLPEGIAIAAGYVTDVKVSLTIAIAIAIHNVPEGICTSAPYYYCSKDGLKAFLLSSSTALPLIGGFLLARFFFSGISEIALGSITAATAGIMIYICADELIPTSNGHSTIFSHLAGIVLVILLGLL